MDPNHSLEIRGEGGTNFRLTGPQKESGQAGRKKPVFGSNAPGRTRKENREGEKELPGNCWAKN